MTTKKTRLDKLLMERGLVESRYKAMGMILSGSVLVDGEPICKAGKLIPVDAEIKITSSFKYVSRGGIKLEKAIQVFGLDVQDMIGVDIGASTGGFTDCLLQHGAQKVYAIDVGYGQLHWKLRRDPRVVNLERTHILKLDWTKIEDSIDIVTIDLSFISLTKVLPHLKEHLSPSTTIVMLVKPQFEVGRHEVGRGGVVRDKHKIEKALEKVKKCAGGLGYKIKGIIPSPITGQKGNIEYFFYINRSLETN